MSSTNPPTTSAPPLNDSLIGNDLAKIAKRMKAVARFVANPVAEKKKKIGMKVDKKNKVEVERLAEWDEFLQSGKGSHEAVLTKT